MVAPSHIDALRTLPQFYANVSYLRNELGKNVQWLVEVPEMKDNIP